MTFERLALHNWQHIADHDRLLHEAMRPVLLGIMDGSIPGQVYPPSGRFTTLRVRGRDDVYMVAWRPTNDGPVVLHIGSAGV